MVLRLPIRDMAARVPDLEDRAARLIPRGNEALKLLAGYARVLRETDDADARRLAVAHVEKGRVRPFVRLILTSATAHRRRASGLHRCRCSGSGRAG